MILTGKEVYKRKIVDNIIDEKTQIQPCGIDFTLKHIISWKSFGVVDFDNSKRKNPEVLILDFEKDNSIFLEKGSYLIEFNETVDMPKDIMGQLYVRSSLFRSGVLISAGVMDSGYSGVVGGLIDVVNPFGVKLYKNAKVCQYVFHQMTQPVDIGYSGKYQNAKSLV